MMSILILCRKGITYDIETLNIRNIKAVYERMQQSDVLHPLYG